MNRQFEDPIGRPDDHPVEELKRAIARMGEDDVDLTLQELREEPDRCPALDAEVREACFRRLRELRQEATP